MIAELAVELVAELAVELVAELADKQRFQLLVKLLLILQILF